MLPLFHNVDTLAYENLEDNEFVIDATDEKSNNMCKIANCYGGGLMELSNDLNLEIKKLTASNNVDLYVVPTSSLKIALNTNSIVFEDISFVEDSENTNALELTVSSSLPYEVKSYLETDIAGTTYNEKLEASILNIKLNSDASYKSFTRVGEGLVLADNQPHGDDIVYNLDLKIKGGKTVKADIYRTVVKFEVNQI
jgi:hypothetical protein